MAPPPKLKSVLEEGQVGAMPRVYWTPIAVEIHIIGSVSEGDKVPLIQRRAGRCQIIGAIEYVILPVSVTSRFDVPAVSPHIIRHDAGSATIGGKIYPCAPCGLRNRARLCVEACIHKCRSNLVNKCCRPVYRSRCRRYPSIISRIVSICCRII